MSLSANFSEVSVGLVTRYVSEPSTLSSVEKTRVEKWIKEYPHVREDVEELRKYQHFFQGAQSSNEQIKRLRRQQELVTQQERLRRLDRLAAAKPRRKP